MRGSKKERIEFVMTLLGWVKNTTLSADKIAKYLGAKTSFVQRLIDEERK